jgi:hypothetical protein
MNRNPFSSLLNLSKGKTAIALVFISGYLGIVCQKAIADRTIEFTAPPPSSDRPNNNSQLYRIYIKGSSRELLQQVRSVEPLAFVRRKEGVIQAGLFIEEWRAKSRLQQLQSQGIKAEIRKLGSDNSNKIGTNNFSDIIIDRPESSAAPNKSRLYYAIVPGKKEDLASREAQLVWLGISPDAFRIKENPRGLHIAVGPFRTRQEAESWSNYLRSYGMDARVFYGRW